jgi:AraC-like DNA-binding protein
MVYLAHWRLRLGAEILQTSDDSVKQVAATVGYGSEAAFNRAFKRAFALPPAAFRQRRNALQLKFAVEHAGEFRSVDIAAGDDADDLSLTGFA